jgi:hypothetical protein
MEKHSYILKEALKSRIKEFIQPIQSPKLIFAHEDLLSLFNFAYDFKFNDLLHKEDKLYEFEEDNEAIDKSESAVLVFLLHPIPSAMGTIASMIQRNQTSAIKKEYKLCFIPKVDIICL